MNAFTVKVTLASKQLNQMLHIASTIELQTSESFESQVYDKQTLVQPIQSKLDPSKAASGIVIQSFFLVSYPKTGQFLWVPVDTCILKSNDFR